MGGRSVGIAAALAVFVLDQASKWWILESVLRPPTTIPVTGFFNLVLVWNRGISFGLFDSDAAAARWVLVAIALAIAGGLGVWLFRARGRIEAVALGLVIGGAAGNVVDRLRFGAVADFLDFHAFGYHWPAFNAADSAITVGAVLLIADSLFGRGDRRNT